MKAKLLPIDAKNLENYTDEWRRRLERIPSQSVAFTRLTCKTTEACERYYIELALIYELRYTFISYAKFNEALRILESKKGAWRKDILRLLRQDYIDTIKATYKKGI